jgi:hypothetical protein
MARFGGPLRNGRLFYALKNKYGQILGSMCYLLLYLLHDNKANYKAAKTGSTGQERSH